MDTVLLKGVNIYLLKVAKRNQLAPMFAARQKEIKHS